MKRIAVLLALLLALSLAACSRSETAPAETAPQETAEAADQETADAAAQETAEAAAQESADAAAQESADAANQETAEAADQETAEAADQETAEAVDEAGAEAAAQETAETADAETAGTPDEQGAEADGWRSVSEEEARSLCPMSFTVPADAQNARWSVREDGENALVQLTFEEYDMTFTAREQVTGDENVNLSGLECQWTVQLDSTLQTWRDGLMACQNFRFYDETGEQDTVDLCRWYDVEIGISYSLSVSAPDLDGFDLQAVAEQMAPAAE